MTEEELRKHIEIKEMENITVEDYLRWKHPGCNLSIPLREFKCGLWRVWID